MSGKLQVLKRTFPITDKVGSQEFTFKLMDAGDRAGVLEFARKIPPNEIVFLRMDITQPEVVDEWLARIEKGTSVTVLAIDEKGKVAGYSTLHHNSLLWTRHLGEIRLFVRDSLRGIGLGKRLTNEIFQIAQEQHLKRLIVNIPRDQPHVRQMLERLGFHAEALLSDWLMSGDGRTHDLLIMSHFLDE